MTDLTSALPEYVVEAIREALPQIDKKIPGFAMHDAVLTGVETRTSSPIRFAERRLSKCECRWLYPAAKARDTPGHLFGRDRRDRSGRGAGIENDGG